MTENPRPFTIRPVHELEPLAPVVALQSDILHLDPRHTIPPRLLKTHASHGGTALCLYDAEEQMRGFAFYFPGQLAGSMVAWVYRLVLDAELSAASTGDMWRALHRAAHGAGLKKLCWTVSPWWREEVRETFQLPGVRCARFLPGDSPISANGGSAPLQGKLLIEWPCADAEPYGEILWDRAVRGNAKTILAPVAGTLAPRVIGATGETAVRIVLPAVTTVTASSSAAWHAAVGRSFHLALDGDRVVVASAPTADGGLTYVCGSITPARS